VFFHFYLLYVRHFSKPHCCIFWSFMAYRYRQPPNSRYIGI